MTATSSTVPRARRGARCCVWPKDNMLAAIAIITGRLKRAVRGTGFELALDKLHPDTDRSLPGFQIPDWSRALELVCQAATVLPGVRTQSCDVANSREAPVLLEVKFGGDIDLTQLAEGRGEHRFRMILHSYGIVWKHSQYLLRRHAYPPPISNTQDSTSRALPAWLSIARSCRRRSASRLWSRAIHQST